MDDSMGHAASEQGEKSMTFGDGVPRWARRRAERHLARHGDGRVVRWMAFAPRTSGARDAVRSVEAAGNVLPFMRRAPVAGPDAAPALGATGS